jgi:hypothetical protein
MGPSMRTLTTLPLPLPLPCRLRLAAVPTGGDTSATGGDVMGRDKIEHYHRTLPEYGALLPIGGLRIPIIPSTVGAKRRCRQ